MSLFICSDCGCVENSNLCTPAYSVDEKEDGFPNMSSMAMHGFDVEYDKTGVRSPVVLLCSECNTGTWHGEFPKEKATEVEIIMGEQLQGDEKNVFTFHPLWRAYNHMPEEFDITILDKIDLKPDNSWADLKQEFVGSKTLDKSVYDEMSWPMHREPYVREDDKVGRNSPCPCGSGKKYKKCCK